MWPELYTWLEVFNEFNEPLGADKASTIHLRVSRQQVVVSVEGHGLGLEDAQFDRVGGGVGSDLLSGKVCWKGGKR